MHIKIDHRPHYNGLAFGLGLSQVLGNLIRAGKFMNIFVLGLSIALLSGCQTHGDTSWHQSKLSQNGQFQIHLSCKTPPRAGPYQECLVKIMQTSGEIVLNANVVVDGGMPAHGHGLPTQPVAISMNEHGAYRVDGLQYNMGGAWILGFLIRTPQQQDKVVFEFII